MSQVQLEEFLLQLWNQSPRQRILVLLNDKWYLGTTIMATEVFITTKLSLLLSLFSRQS